MKSGSRPESRYRASAWPRAKQASRSRHTLLAACGQYFCRRTTGPSSLFVRRKQDAAERRIIMLGVSHRPRLISSLSARNRAARGSHRRTPPRDTGSPRCHRRKAAAVLFKEPRSIFGGGTPCAFRDELPNRRNSKYRGGPDKRATAFRRSKPQRLE